MTIPDARALAVDVLRAHRLDEHDAGVVADHLVDAQLTGYTFAGLPRLLVVLDRLRAQADQPRRPVEVERETPVSATVAGHGALGYVVCQRAVEVAIEKAERSGLAMVGASDSYYSGRSGYYVDQAARRGFVAIHASSAFPMVAPAGGRRPLLGSNPIAFSFPTAGDPITIDLSTASSTWGALQLAEREGHPLPDGQAIDAAGRPTTDPTAALQGAILPAAGHKGSAIAVAVQALGLVSGGSAVPAPFGNFGFFFAVFRRDLFVDAAEYDRRIAELADAVRSADPVPGGAPVTMPGDGSVRRRREALARGTVDVPDATYRALVALRDERM